MRYVWSAWILLTLVIGGYFGWSVLASEDKAHLLIGQSTAGHYQIELECQACHSDAFGGMESVNESCLGCHAQELDEAHDSHPKSKFTDPRNADRIEILDARYCVSCHTEHQEEHTRAMGVTLPDDYCWHCHQDVAENRPSHEGMAFDTCASAGCHNYHDNRALYEDFLLKHADEPEIAEHAALPVRDGLAWFRSLEADIPPLTVTRYPEGRQIPDGVDLAQVESDWLASTHAQVGVDCGGCHLPQEKQSAESSHSANDWVEKPGLEVCEGCHERQSDSFKQGKHGMRLAQGLSPMTPAQARLPMHEAAMDLELGCNSCHDPHRQDLVVAATESCLGCHADEHSQNFEASPHGQLWQQVLAGSLPMEEGVSCATCHLPREIKRVQGHEKVVVQHNQNANLRPNEKMIRSVCMNCHGLGFSLDALADPESIHSNFNGNPSTRVESIEMAVQREGEKP